MAQDQLFLFFSGLLQRFDLASPHGPENVDTAPHVGFIHSCPAYDVSLRPRCALAEVA